MEVSEPDFSTPYPILDAARVFLEQGLITPAQHAALAAFQPETLAILETRRQAFGTRRDALLEDLKQMGFGIDISRSAPSTSTEAPKSWSETECT